MLDDHEILDSCRDYYSFAMESVNSVTVYDYVQNASRWDYFSSDIETFNSITAITIIYGMMEKGQVNCSTRLWQTLTLTH